MENEIFKLAEEKEARYERKFFLSNFNFAVLKSVINFHPACFKKNYPNRRVNNLYLDTFDKKSYFDNLTGISQRIKTRIRWYGENFDEIENPILELKIKNGYLGTKLQYPLVSFDQGGNLNQITQLGIRQSDLPDFIKMYLKQLRRSAANSYLRQYYVSTDNRFRLTVDSGLCFYGPNKKIIDRNKSDLILELKYSSEFDNDARFITSRFPFFVTKSSKYVAAMERGYFYF